MDPADRPSVRLSIEFDKQGVDKSSEEADRERLRSILAEAFPDLEKWRVEFVMGSLWARRVHREMTAGAKAFALGYYDTMQELKLEELKREGMIMTKGS